MENDYKPQLRPLDFQRVVYQGQSMWFLRDPLQLSNIQLFLPEAIAPLLTFMDGKHTRDDIHAAFCDSVGVQLDSKITFDAIDRLNDSFLLDNENTERVKLALLAEFRSQPYRSPALAGTSYPSEPAELTRHLQSYASGSSATTWQGRGIVSPHIDYGRGGTVYSQVWQGAEEAILNADLVLIFGTDHYGGLNTITLTKQAYATPYGVLPAEVTLVDKLAAALGTEAAYADELNHRHEHSVELSAVWLHHIFHQAGKEPCPVVPILVGSFQQFLVNGKIPATDDRLTAFIDALQKETAGRRVLTVASVDLAHVGPNFGDQFVMDEARRADLAELDQNLMNSAIRGDAESWFSQIEAVGDRNRICGFSPTYLMLRYLGETNGMQVAYDQCPADDQDTSLVSICGLLID